jgi:predicted HicB family RNase H-like nuclease
MKSKMIKVSEETHRKLKEYAKRNYMKINGLIDKMIDEKIKSENEKID